MASIAWLHSTLVGVLFAAVPVFLWNSDEEPSINFTFETVTLTQWTDAVLKKCPVYLGASIQKASVQDTPLTFIEFKKALTHYHDKQSKDLTFNDRDLWFNKKMPSAKNTDQSYAQKLTIPDTSEVFFCGDLHGSVHALVRTLLSLVVQGYLDNNFKIKKDNFYMVFLGDYVDRGYYGSEVLYTLCKLKIANWDKVFLLRGNHEDRSISETFGFTGNQSYWGRSTLKDSEIDKKFKANAPYLLDAIEQWYGCLSHVLFLDNATGSWIQCCHGGIETNYSPRKFLMDDDTHYQLLNAGQYEGLNWSDVVIGQKSCCTRSSRGAGWETTVGFVQDYLDENGLYALVRGHADMEFWFKLFFPSELVKTDFTTGEFYIKSDDNNGRYYFQRDPACAGGPDSRGIPIYKNGPYNWRKVVSLQDFENENGFLLSNYPPIFTFTNAIESRQLVDGGGYSIVSMDGPFKKWLVKAYSLESNVVNPAPQLKI